MGLPYEGLPATLEEAATRRAERMVISEVARSDVAQGTMPPIGAMRGYTLDLRLCAQDAERRGDT